MQTLQTPHSAAGPALRELIVGSEGTIGVIPEVSVRVRPAPPVRRYEAWMAESFEAGAEIVRAMAQGGALPDVIRVSDEEETRVSLALSGPQRRGAPALRGLPAAAAAQRRLPDRRRRRGRAGVGRAAKGAGGAQAARRGRRIPRTGRRALLGAGPLQGPLPARHAAGSGLHGRDAGDIAHLVEARRAAPLGRCSDPRLARRAGNPRGSSSATSPTPIPTGPRSTSPSSPAPSPSAEIEQWAEVKRAACEAIVAAGATITHHHAVGRDHAPYMEAEVGPLGLEALRAVKERLDPEGIMNPGKLLP